MTEGPEAGFSLVEVLIAIAITSLVAMAAGGLLVLGVAARDRVDESIRIEASLLALGSLAALTGGEVWMGAESAENVGFALVGTDKRWQVDLSEGPSIALQQRERTNRVDLSPFEDVSLEYLVRRGDGGAWVGAEAISSAELVAVRLRLASGRRVWRPLVWAASEWPVPQ